MRDQLLLDDLNVEASIANYIKTINHDPYFVTVEYGSKYITIIKNYSLNKETIRETVCFVSKENGNIFKAYKETCSRVKVDNIFNY